MQTLIKLLAFVALMPTFVANAQGSGANQDDEFLKNLFMYTEPSTVSEVWIYTYQEEKVYLVTYKSELYETVFDREGTYLCAPVAGVEGKGDGKCTDFHSLKTDGKVLWSSMPKEK